MFQKKIKENIFLILSVSLTIFAIFPLLHSGFFPIHDNEQVGRLFELDQALRAGQFPVRIISDLGFGYGYLLFNYYPPLVYYFGEIFILVNTSYIDSIKLVMGFGFIFSAVSMYFFVREMYGKIAGFVSSVFYTYAPYHSVDLYVRGALPEFFSFVFIPAIFWSYLKLSRENSKRYVVIAALFNSLLLLTHNLVALMASLFIGIYLIFILLNLKDRKVFLKNVLLTGLFSALLSSFFIIPAILENKYTMVSLLTKELADYKIHFVSPIQLWNSAWGYGGSGPGVSDGLTFKLGKLHVLLSIWSIIIAFYYLIKKNVNKEIFLFSILLLFSLFIQTQYSKFIWDHFQPFSYIQFPWRYLLFSAFFMSILIGFLSKELSRQSLGKILILFMVVYVLFQGRLIFKPQSYISVTDNDYISQKTLRWETSKMAFEYVPVDIALKKSKIGNSVVDITENQVAKSAFQVKSGQMNIITMVDIPHRIEMSAQVVKGGELIINQFAYPGWKIFVDGRQIGFNSNNKLKLISLRLSAGDRIIEARFEDTKLRMVSNLLTLVGIISIILYVLPLGFKKYAKN
jgi:uncharacterized membrane protein